MNMSIKSNIENRRYRLQALHEELPLFEAEEARLKAELGRIQKDRLWLRRTCKPNMQLALCRAHITRLRQRLDEKKFDERLRPFLQAAERTLTEATASKPSVLRLPGATKRRKLSSLNNYIASKDNSLHGSVLHEYMVEFEQAAPDINVDCSGSLCTKCNMEFVYMDRKSQATCPKCGQYRSFLDATTASLTYKSDVEFNMFSYKRTSHFVDWLANCQGKERFVISDDVVQAVMKELYNRRVKPEDVNIASVRDVVKSLKLRRVYEHVTQLCCRLTGTPPPILKPQVEEVLKLLFHTLLGPFEQHKGTRKNMLSYGYVLSKLVGLLGITSKNVPLLQFSLLKGVDKLRRQDAIWRCICETLDWQFVPSV
jgi:hypothetical protein